MTSNNGNNSSSGESTSSLPRPQTDERLMVAVRIRPGQDSNDDKCLKMSSKNSLLFYDTNKTSHKKYVYNYVFGETSSQKEVYETTTAPLVKDVLDGYQAAVFAYGATGSGKTHTMLGNNPLKAATPNANPNTPYSTEGDGLMVRAIIQIFSSMQEEDDPDKIHVSISYLEIYNELIKDLLNPGGPLELREDNRGQKITVAGLSEVTALNQYEVIQLLLKGNKARTIEPTAANQTSSRSHALLSINVTRVTPFGTKQGRLFLTDLAGSERAKKTKNRGKRLQEGAHINRSLLALGNCINALSGGARYVNYRDSKLTRLLKEALSGKCKTVMIAHVSPDSRQRDETKNTLVYADRANNITTRLQNPDYMEETREFPLTHYQTLVTELREEVGRLRTKILSNRPRSETAPTDDTSNHGDQKRRADLRYLREQIVITFKLQMRLRRRLLEAESHLLGLELDAERQHMVISHWQGRTGKLYDNQYGQDSDAIQSEERSSLKAAWAELATIEKESQRYKEIKKGTENELEACRQKGVALEDELPEKISSDEEKEILALLCRVHELEADKVTLQAERLARQAELRRRDLQLLRAERQRKLCEDIISSQRKLIKDENVELPLELQDMYAQYQQEIHTSTYTGFITTSSELYDRKLPPIYSRSSNLPGSSDSSGSDWSPSPLPPIENSSNVHPDHLMGPPVTQKLPTLVRKSSRE